MGHSMSLYTCKSHNNICTNIYKTMKFRKMVLHEGSVVKFIVEVVTLPIQLTDTTLKL